MSWVAQVDVSSEVRKKLFRSFKEHLSMLAKFDDLILENRQHVRREIQNHYHWMPSWIMEILKDYFVFQLTPLMNILTSPNVIIISVFA